MKIQIKDSGSEVVETTRHCKIPISCTVIANDEETTVEAELYYDEKVSDGETTRTGNSLITDGMSCDLDCIAEVLLDKARKTFPDMSDEDYKKMGSKIDGFINELIAENEIQVD